MRFYAQVDNEQMNRKFDLILVGTGFASSFFLSRFLERTRNTTVLVLERGFHDTHEWRIKNRARMHPSGVVSSIDFEQTFINDTPEKPWVYTPSFGGSSNCWWACTPRFMPTDFELQSRFGVGRDWPLRYDDLEPYYCAAEEMMAIAGPTVTPFPMSRPYPQAAHQLTSVDRKLAERFPDTFFTMPSARPTRGTTNRVRCCASGVCNLCPVDAKFTVLNELGHLYQDKRVSLEFGAQVLAVDIENKLAKGVLYLKDGVEHRASGEVVALGANALFNPHILLNSGVEHPLLGGNLAEQVAISCDLWLRNTNNFDGSTSLTGHGYMLYDGDHRKRHAACLVETFNIPRLRLERGAYTRRAFLKFIFEDLPRPSNGVVGSNDRAQPKVSYHGHSDYVERAKANVREQFENLFGFLELERIDWNSMPHPTEGHILCTVPMGLRSDDSIVNRYQVLHSVSNLLSLGGSSFASVSPANPTLTIAALSLWSADHYFS